MKTLSLACFVQFARRSLAPALVLTACSCSSMRQQTAKTDTDPFLSDEETPVVARDGNARSRFAPTSRSSGPVRHVELEQEVSSETGRVTQTGGTSELPNRQVLPDHQTLPARGAAPARRTAAVAQAGWQQPALPPNCPPNAGYAQGRMTFGELGAAQEAIALSPDAMVRQYPDEYLFDGGDRGYPVHFDDISMRGLETEDTVAEYLNEEGQRKVKPTNRVAVYSPRFAAVTSVSATLEDVSQDMLSEAAHHVPGMAMRGREATFAHQQRDRGVNLQMRARASGVKTEGIAGELQNPVAFDGHVHTTVVLEDLSFVHTGQMNKTDEARLAASIDSAHAWTRNQNPSIAAQSDSAGELRSKFDVQEMVGREDQNKPGRLRIVKLADKKIAAPGEIVKFTIRFDNLGDRPVRAVVISDNLTPRLEYVDDSATCDRDGRLDVIENGEGSVILRWELAEPLPGRTGGVATFEARIR